MLRLLTRQKGTKYFKELADIELFDQYKKCDIDSFAYLYEKFKGSITAILIKTIGFNNTIEHDDILQDKLLMFLEKTISQKKNLNKEKKSVKNFLITSFKNHGINYLIKGEIKNLYLNAIRDEEHENNVSQYDESTIEQFVDDLGQFISLNETQKEYLKLYCKGYKPNQIADKLSRSKSYTENVLTQIRQKLKEDDNRELITNHYLS